MDSESTGHRYRANFPPSPALPTGQGKTLQSILLFAPLSLYACKALFLGGVVSVLHSSSSLENGLIPEGATGQNGEQAPRTCNVCVLTSIRNMAGAAPGLPKFFTRES